MHLRAVTTREAKQMNLRSKFTDAKHLVLASGNHYRGPLVPRRVVNNLLAANTELFDNCAITVDICLCKVLQNTTTTTYEKQ